MFPSNRFKGVGCPFGTSCLNKEFCLFSHEIPRPAPPVRPEKRKSEIGEQPRKSRRLEKKEEENKVEEGKEVATRVVQADENEKRNVNLEVHSAPWIVPIHSIKNPIIKQVEVQRRKELTQVLLLDFHSSRLTMVDPSSRQAARHPPRSSLRNQH